MNNIRTDILALSFLLVLTSIVQAAVPEKTLATPSTLVKAEPLPGNKTPDERLLYRYQGDKYRDPFVPLIGEARMDLYDRPPQMASLDLKGIVEDQRSRIALLTSGVASYILRGGRLYDGRNKIVKGISGVVKARSVILIGSDRSVREIKVKTNL